MTEVALQLAPEDVVEGVPVCAAIEGKRIAIYRLGDELFGLSDICTHEHAHLSEGYVDGETIECPMHQACFSIRTGKALSPIAPTDLATYEIAVRDGQVIVKL